MTTNVDDDHAPITDGDAPCNNEYTEDSTQETSCKRCAELQEELERSQRDRALYTSIKKKITLTDTLIRKYNSKCQEFDQQQKKLEDVAYKLASAKRDCKILEKELTSTLEEIIPWKLHKDKYLKELEECRAKLRETEDKLAGSEASCVQFKDGFYEMQEKLETLEGNQTDLKKAAEKSQQAEKKTSALLAKNKDDLSTCKKELQSAKKREARLVTRHQQAKNKISELVQILRDRGIPVPKVPKSLLGGSAYGQESVSTEDTDFEQVGEVFSPPMEFLSPARHESSVVEDHSEREEDTGHPSFKEDACLKIFNRFSCDMSACVSPLPPSPMLSDASSDISGDEVSDDEVFSDVADQIESQLNLVETGDVGETSRESKEELTEGKRQLRQTPQRRAVAQRKSRDANAEKQDDSAEETSGKKQPSRRRQKGSKKGATEISTPSGRPADVVEVLSETDSEASGNLHASSHETGGSATEFDRQGGPGKGKSGIPKESRKSSSLDEDNYQERHFNERGREELLGFSSTLSDDSDDNQEDTKYPPTEPSRHRTGTNWHVADFGSPSTVEGRHQSLPQIDLRQSQDDTWDEHKKLVLSPDRRLTRSQLKTLTERGVIEPTDAVKPSLSSCQNQLKSPAKRTLEHSERDKNASKRPVTRSLSVSEAESSTEGASPSPARPVCRKLLRSNSALEGKPSSKGLASAATQISPVHSPPRRLRHSVSLLEQTSSLAEENPETKNEDTKPTAVDHKDNIPKKFNRSVSVPGNKSSEMVVESFEKLEDSRGRSDTSVRRITRSQALHLQSQDKNEIFPKRITRSAAKTSNMKTEARDLPHKTTTTSPRLGKKSDTDSSSIQEEDKECTSRGLRTISTESQDSDIADASSLLVNSESRNPEQILDCDPAEPHHASSESKTWALETPTISVNSRSNCNKICNDGNGMQSSSDMKHDKAEGLEESEVSHMSLVPQTGQEASGGQKDTEVRKNSENKPPESENHNQKADDSSGNGVRSTREVAEKLSFEAAEESQENGDRHLELDEPRVAESEQSEQGHMLGVGEEPFDFERFVGETSKSESEDGQPDREGTPTPDVDPTRGSNSSLEELFNKGDKSRGVMELEEGGDDRQNCVSSATKEATSHVGLHLRNGDDGPGNVEDLEPASCDVDGRKNVEMAQTNSLGRGSSSAEESDLRSKDDGPVEGMKHQPTEDDGNLRENKATRRDPSTHTSSNQSGSLCWEDISNQGGRGSSSAEESDLRSRDDGPVKGMKHHPTEDDGNLRENKETRRDPSTHTSSNQSGSLCWEDISNQGASTSNNREAQRQVLCVEAESSRASTPTTDEVISINSVAGHVSPVSPLPLQYTTRPLSPLSSPPRSPPLSPLAPSPISLEGFVSFPRMLSPLPPSPGIPDYESPDDAGHSALTEGIPGSGLVNQPRMISPLFPTPVPPAVSPLPEAPSANLLSPLSDASSVRLDQLDRSPMISPLRNPLIPSPCNFHAVAPSDALSVRPQHYPVPRRQPASRCLATSFTSTAAGTSQNPEIISPRLHSLASEMIFEFGEARPSTSGLQRPQPSQMPTSSFRQENRGNQATDCTETLKDPKLKGQRSGISGFMELRSKPSTSKNDPKDSDVKKQQETNGQSVLEKENSKNNLDSCEMVQQQITKDDKTPPYDQKDSDPPKTRRRRKEPSSSQKKDLKSLLVNQDIRRWQRKISSAQTTLHRQQKEDAREVKLLVAEVLRLLFLVLQEAEEKTLRLRRKSDTAGKDSGSVSKTPKRRKRSNSSSDQTETVAKESDSQPKGQTGASSIQQEIEKNEEHGSAIPVQSVMSGQPSARPKRGRIMLIPALELKTSGFKKSCSMRKREVKQEDEANLLLDEVKPEFKEDVKPEFKEEVKLEFKEEVKPEFKTDGEKEHFVCQQNGNVLESAVKQENADAPVRKSSDSTGRVGAKVCKTVQQPTLQLGPDPVSLPRSAQLAQRPGTIVPQNEASSKLNKPKSSIGSIWADMACRKEPDLAICNQGLKKLKQQKKKKCNRGQDRGPSQPQVSPSKSSQNCGRVEGFDDVLLAKAKAELTQVDPTNQKEAQKTANPRTDPGTLSLTQKTGLSDAAPAVASSSGHQTSYKPQLDQIRLPKLALPKLALPKLAQAHSKTASTHPHLGMHSQMDTFTPLQAELRSAIVAISPLVTTDANPITRSLSVAEQCTLNNGQQSTGDISELAQPSLQTGPPISVISPRSQNEHRIVTPEVKTLDRQTLQARTGLNLDNRKRHVSRKDDLTCDTNDQPSPCKQAKMSPGRRLPESRSEFKHPMSEVIPSVSKVASQEPHRPVLSDLLEQVKTLRSQTNAKPLFASILTFLGQQGISLMPAIQAKCLTKNTSTKPLLLHHEEQLVAGIVEGGLLSKKSNTSMLLACLCRGVRSPPSSTSATPAVVVGAAFCRVVAALCRKMGLIDRVRIFCYDLLREGFPNVEELLLNVAVTWPTVLRRKEGSSSPIIAAMEIVAMQRLVLSASPQNLQAQEIIHYLSEICGWGIPDGNLPIVRCRQLVASIQDTNVTKLFNTGTPTQALTPKSYEIVKALELLAYHLGWQWTNNRLIREKLWPILKAWSHQVQAAHAATGPPTGSGQNKPAPTGIGHCVQSPADASACAAMKVIGDVAGLGLDSHKESVCELLKMLAAVLQQPSASVPWTVQVFTAEAVLCLSPSNPTFALEVTQKWRRQAQFAPPLRIEDKLCMLEKVVGAIHNVSK
ncbi:LOW QUALITY PROTEIN: uncharacterized protein LOC119724136 [Patiria miniata]|uniref:Little elongation complex subunit 1 C-terminal domain-containing protein n=1 Tax=Patiria miniata TaxID=46514 RepID=A0A913ZIV8_PATMI|nr:LOW QUALITY PROTEIN: uncharacterized protein LOC119724136 [Patiria miniata]